MTPQARSPSPRFRLPQVSRWPRSRTICRPHFHTSPDRRTFGYLDYFPFRGSSRSFRPSVTHGGSLDPLAELNRSGGTNRAPPITVKSTGIMPLFRSSPRALNAANVKSMPAFEGTDALGPTSISSTVISFWFPRFLTRTLGLVFFKPIAGRGVPCVLVEPGRGRAQPRTLGSFAVIPLAVVESLKFDAFAL